MKKREIPLLKKRACLWRVSSVRQNVETLLGLKTCNDINQHNFWLIYESALSSVILAIQLQCIVLYTSRETQCNIAVRTQVCTSAAPTWVHLAESTFVYAFVIMKSWDMSSWRLLCWEIIDPIMRLFLFQLFIWNIFVLLLCMRLMGMWFLATFRTCLFAVFARHKYKGTKVHVVQKQWHVQCTGCLVIVVVCTTGQYLVSRPDTGHAAAG